MSTITCWPATNQRLSVPMVLLHGWGADSRVWQDLRPFLADWTDVYVVDIDYQKESVEQLVQRLLKQLPDQFFLCGWSLGGMLALRIAALAQQRVKYLLTLASNAQFVADGEWTQAMPQVTFKQFVAGARKNLPKTLKRFAVLQSHGDVLAKEQLLWYQNKTHQVTGDLLAGLDLLGAINNRQLLSAIECPALHCFGEYDPLVPVAVMDELKALVSPNQQMVSIKGAAHLLHYPTQRFWPIMQSCLAQLEGNAPHVG